ncbi:MAG: hypothetical protein WEC59_07840 [Salibacteraceae bacterium]
MKKAITIFVLLFSVHFLVAQNESINQLDANGQKDGVWEQNYPNDQLRYRGQFEHGQPVGTFFYYTEDGKKSSEVTHLDDKRAKAVFFHQNGTIMGKGNYLNKEKHGEWRFYDNHTILSSIDSFDQGKLVGTRKVYHLNGQVASIVPYVMGLKNGSFKEFAPNGQVIIEGTYADNTFDGEYKQYYDDGTPYIEGFYKSAVKDSLWIYYHDDGRVKLQELYDTGELLKRKVEEGFKEKEIEMDIEESEIIDEEQLKEQFLSNPPR